ncbi:MAG: hypothetical protein JOZ93_11800 [Sinobacteraceae bacterium]|nr:hypothetical protein [Nevskiaceae bacterium]
MNRRDSLRVMRGAIWAAAIAHIAATQSALRAAVPVVPASAGQNAVRETRGAAPPAIDVQLRRDVDRLASRVYSDEGILVFLACEDLTRKGGPAPALTPLNTQLAAQIHDNAAAWERLYPHAKAEDLSKLVEILAQRDLNGLQSRG